MYYLACYSLKILSYLPFWLLYLLADLLYFIIYYVVKYRVEVVRDNLSGAFPELSTKELKRLEKKFYHHFADQMVEIIKEAGMSESEMMKRVKFVNYEAIIKHFSEGKSVIGMTSHMGNWEWLTSFSLHLPENHKMVQVYKRLRNKVSDRIFYNLRVRFGSENVEMNMLLRKMVSNRNDNKTVFYALISDQSPRINAKLFFINFLNRPTDFFIGGEELAVKFDFPVYYLSVKMEKRGYYVAEFMPITLIPKKEETHYITNTYAKLLENDIKRQPELWLWSHKRWKHKPN